MFNTTGSRGGKKRTPLPLVGNFLPGASGSAALDLQNGGNTSLSARYVPSSGNFASSDFRLQFGNNVSLSYMAAFVGLGLTDTACTAFASFQCGGLGCTNANATNAFTTSDVEIANPGWRRSMTLINTAAPAWSQTNSVAGAVDTGIGRASIGVFELNTGTLHSLSGAYLNWGGQARVTSDFSKTDATLADITGLSSTITVGSTAGTRAYSFDGWFPCTMGSSAGGIKFAVTCTSTAVTSIIYSGYALNNGTVQGSSIQATAIGTAVAVSTGPATALSAYIKGTIRVASSGLLKFQFAQVSSNATASVVSSGAYVWVHDMP